MDGNNFANNVFSITEINANGGRSDIFDDIRGNNFRITEGIPKLSGRDKQYIRFGLGNKHPYFLLNLFEKSGIHQSIIRTKANLTMGDGFQIEGEDSDKAHEFLNKIRYMDHIHQNICWDLSIFGGFCVQHIYANIPNIETSARELRVLYHHPFQDFRLSPPEQMNTGVREPTKGLIHSNWSKRTKKSDIKELPLWFDENDPIKGETCSNLMKDKFIGGTNMIYYGKIYSPNTKYYPAPDYQSETGMNAIILDNEVILYDVKELQNNMTAGFIVTFVRNNYSSTDPEKEKKLRAAEESMVKNDLKGAKNNKRIIITRAEPPEEGQEIRQPMQLTEVPNNSTAERHNIIDKRKNVAILVAHGLATAEIAGIPDLNKGAFSSQKDLLVQAVDMLFEFRIKPFRKEIIKYINCLFEEANLKVEKTSFIDKIPFRDKISDNMWKHAFTIDEYRKENGYPAQTEEEKETLNREKGSSPEVIIEEGGQVAISFKNTAEDE